MNIHMTGNRPLEPLRNDNGWYENEVGRYIQLGTGDAAGWQDSLIKVDINDGR